MSAVSKVQESASSTVGVTETARLLVRDQATVYNLQKRGILQAVGFAHPSRRRRFDVADVLRVKDVLDRELGDGEFNTAVGRAFSVVRAARRSGFSESFLRRCLNSTSQLPEGRLPSLKWPPDAKEHWKPRGKTPSERLQSEADRGLTIILETDLDRLRVAVRFALQEARRLNRSKWKISSEIAARLGLKTPAERAELGECLKCWREQGLIGSKSMLQEVRGRPSGHKSTTALRDFLFFDSPRAEELWQADYLTTGAKALRRLFANGRQEVPAAEVHQTMQAIGIAGRRVSRVAEKVGVEARPSGAAGSPWIYRQRGRRLPPASDALRELLTTTSPTKPADGFAQLRGQGYSRLSIGRAIQEGKAKGWFKLRRAGNRGPYYWCADNHASGDVAAAAKKTQGNLAPVWDHSRGALSFNGTILREFKRGKSNQVVLIDAFQAKSWIASIPSPFSDKGILAQTVGDLNRMFKETPLRFGQEGKGREAVATWGLR